MENQNADDGCDNRLNGGDNRDLTAFGNIFKPGKIEDISEDRRNKRKADAYGKHFGIQRILDSRPWAGEDCEKNRCKQEVIGGHSKRRTFVRGKPAEYRRQRIAESRCNSE